MQSIRSSIITSVCVFSPLLSFCHAMDYISLITFICIYAMTCFFQCPIFYFTFAQCYRQHFKYVSVICLPFLLFLFSFPIPIPNLSLSFSLSSSLFLVFNTRPFSSSLCRFLSSSLFLVLHLPLHLFLVLC